MKMLKVKATLLQTKKNAKNLLNHKLSINLFFKLRFNSKCSKNCLYSGGEQRQKAKVPNKVLGGAHFVEGDECKSGKEPAEGQIVGKPEGREMF